MASLSLRPQARPAVGRVGGLLRLAGLALLTVAVVACAPRRRPVEPIPEPEPGPAERPSRLPPDETRNRVAVLVPLSGPNAALGQSILNAANLALLDTGGQRIRITAYDPVSCPAAAANEALADGTGLILGPLFAEDVRAVAPIARREDVPVIAFSNDVMVAGDGVFLMGFEPGQAIDRLVGFARSRGAQRFGGLVPNDSYGHRSREALAEAVEGARGQLVGIEIYDRTTASLRGAAGRLSESGRLDAALIGDGASTAAQAATILRSVLPPQPQILGSELWASDANLSAHVGLRGAWFAAPSDANFAPFRTRYRARYGRNPNRLASLGYDAVLLTVRIASDWPIGRRFPVRALTESTGFSGVDGAFRFRRNGLSERALEVRQITPTGVNVISPAPRSFD